MIVPLGTGAKDADTCLEIAKQHDLECLVLIGVNKEGAPVLIVGGTEIDYGMAQWLAREAGVLLHEATYSSGEDHAVH
jgi:ribonuclease BN (tRNA processing enzyme)